MSTSLSTWLLQVHFLYFSCQTKDIACRGLPCFPRHGRVAAQLASLVSLAFEVLPKNKARSATPLLVPEASEWITKHWKAKQMKKLTSNVPSRPAHESKAQNISARVPCLEGTTWRAEPLGCMNRHSTSQENASSMEAYFKPQCIRCGTQ